MNCFKDFVKYNPNLVELDLSNTKLSNAAIYYLCYCLRRASSLKTLHLCGNMSRPRFVQDHFDEEMKTKLENDPIQIVIDNVRKRLRAKDVITGPKIRPYEKADQSPERCGIHGHGVTKSLTKELNEKKSMRSESPSPLPELGRKASLLKR